MIQATILPSAKSVRISFVDVTELQAIENALRGIGCAIKKNGYTG